MCMCLCVKSHIYIYTYIWIYIYTCIYVYKNQCTCPSMQSMFLCLVYHVCNTILTYFWLPCVFFRSFAHGRVKPIVNSTKWTQRAVKRKAFEHGAKSMVRESTIGVVEIARCLLSKQAKSAGPQWTTLLCFPHYSHLFLTCREPGVPLSLFRPYPLPFSFPFLLYCSLPFLFFHVFFIDLYLL